MSDQFLVFPMPGYRLSVMDDGNVILTVKYFANQEHARSNMLTEMPLVVHPDKAMVLAAGLTRAAGEGYEAIAKKKE